LGPTNCNDAQSNEIGVKGVNTAEREKGPSAAANY